MIQELQGVVTTPFKGATATGTQEVDCYGFNSLMLIHEMTAQTTGAYASIDLRHTQGTPGVAHPAPAGISEFGANVKAAVLATNYVAIYKGISRYVGVTLTRTDGTHTIHAIPINL